MASLDDAIKRAGTWVTDDAARRLMRLAGQDLDALRRQAASRDFRPVNLNLKGAINLRSEVKRVGAPNVVAALAGSDPKLRDQYVVFSAHWDHLGIGLPDANGDRIYNGALDNATGVAHVLEQARLFARGPLALGLDCDTRRRLISRNRFPKSIPTRSSDPRRCRARGCIGHDGLASSERLGGCHGRA